MKKKIIAYVVSAVMVLTMVPATAFAATGTDDSGMSKTAPDALTVEKATAIASMEDAFADRNNGKGEGKYYTSAKVTEWEALINEYVALINGATTTARVNAYESQYEVKLDAIIDAVQIINDYAKTLKAIEDNGAYEAKIDEIRDSYTADNGKFSVGSELTDTEVDALVSEAQAKMDAVTVPVEKDKIDAAVTKYTASLNNWVDDNIYEGARYSDEADVYGNEDIGNVTLGITIPKDAPLNEAIEEIISTANVKMRTTASSSGANMGDITNIYDNAKACLRYVTGKTRGAEIATVDQEAFKKAVEAEVCEYNGESDAFTLKGSSFDFADVKASDYSTFFPVGGTYSEAIKTILGNITEESGGYFDLIYSKCTTKNYNDWRRGDLTTINDYPDFQGFDTAAIESIIDEIQADIDAVPRGKDVLQSDQKHYSAAASVTTALQRWCDNVEAAAKGDTSIDLAELEREYKAIIQEESSTTISYGGSDFAAAWARVFSVEDDFDTAKSNNDNVLAADIMAEMAEIGDKADVNKKVTNTNYNDIADQIKKIEAMFDGFVEAKINLGGTTGTDDAGTGFIGWKEAYMSDGGDPDDAETKGVEYYKETLTKDFISEVDELVRACETANEFDPSNEDHVAAMKATSEAYAKLSDEMKAENVKSTAGTTMAEALETYADYEAVTAPIMNAIVTVEKLMDQATDEASIKAAWDAYNELPEGSQKVVENDLSYELFKAARDAMLTNKAKSVNAVAVGITNYKQVTEEFVDAYEAVVAEYEYYDERISGLSLATSDINNYNDNIVADFQKVIKDIKNNPDKAVAGDAAAIKAARAIYDGMLTDEAKKLAKDSGYLAWLEKYEAAVSQYDLSTGSMTLSATEITLGDAAPTVVVKDATGKDLVADTDYTVAYTGLDQVGEATVTVTGAGSYTGTLEAKITVKAIDLSKGSMTLSATEITLGDAAPTVAVKDATGKELVADTDYTVAYTGFDQVGEATVTVTGTGNYTGTLEAKVAVKAADIDISNGKVIMDGPSIEGGYSYIERGETPDIAVHVDGQPIPETAYTVDFNDKAYAGLTSLTVRANDGSGYDGELTYSYVVVNGAKNIKSIKGAKKSFTVKYSDYSKYGCTGTEIAWKTSKNGEWKYSKITSNDASKKVTVKAAGKKYVKVRAIVKVDGVRYYGDWSKTKTVTVR